MLYWGGGALLALGVIYYLYSSSSASGGTVAASTGVGMSSVVTPSYYLPQLAQPYGVAGTVPVFSTGGAVSSVNATNYLASYTSNPGSAIPSMSPTIGLIPIITNTGGMNDAGMLNVSNRARSISAGFSYGGFGIGGSASNSNINQNVASNTSSTIGQNIGFASGQ